MKNKSSIDYATEIYSQLGKAFITAGEAKKLIDEDGGSDELNIKLKKVESAIGDFDILYKLDNKEYGFTDMIRNAKYLKMDLKRLYDDLILKYKFI